MTDEAENNLDPTLTSVVHSVADSSKAKVHPSLAGDTSAINYAFNDNAISSNDHNDDDVEDVNTSDDDAGSLVDFVVNESEGERTPDERDESINERDLLLKSLPVEWSNEIKVLSHSNGRPKRIKKRPIRFEEEYAADIAKVMLEDVPADELEAAMQESDDGDESTLVPADMDEEYDDRSDSDLEDEDDEDDDDDSEDDEDEDEEDNDEDDTDDEDNDEDDTDGDDTADNDKDDADDKDKDDTDDKDKGSANDHEDDEDNKDDNVDDDDNEDDDDEDNDDDAKNNDDAKSDDTHDEHRKNSKRLKSHGYAKEC